MRKETADIWAFIDTETARRQQLKIDEELRLAIEKVGGQPRGLLACLPTSLLACLVRLLGRLQDRTQLHDCLPV